MQCEISHLQKTKKALYLLKVSEKQEIKPLQIDQLFWGGNEIGYVLETAC